MQKLALDINQMVRFSRLMLQLQSVRRALYTPGENLRENDVEHSYHLAMMAWYLNSAGDLGYDADRLLRYGLVHDLAEAYAGDVHALDAAGRQAKPAREAAAIHRISQEFPESAEILEALHTYEQRGDDEARFIYALDKLMPILMVYMDGGRTWREEGLALERLHNNKVDKVAVSPPVDELYQQLKSLLDDRPEFFGK